MDLARKGLDATVFKLIVTHSPFSVLEWASMMHLPEGKKIDLADLEFRPIPLDLSASPLSFLIYNERILKIAQLSQRGEKIFGTAKRFKHWLDTENQALGDVKPQSLLDSAFGIDIIHDELTRIEHGILA